MFHPDQVNVGTTAGVPTLIASAGSRACLVEGCTCKDARIVSHRRAAFFADLARRNGETADRVISPEPGWTWTLPTTGADA